MCILNYNLGTTIFIYHFFKFIKYCDHALELLRLFGTLFYAMLLLFLWGEMLRGGFYLSFYSLLGSDLSISHLFIFSNAYVNSLTAYSFSWRNEAVSRWLSMFYWDSPQLFQRWSISFPNNPWYCCYLSFFIVGRISSGTSLVFSYISAILLSSLSTNSLTTDLNLSKVYL